MDISPRTVSPTGVSPTVPFVGRFHELDVIAGFLEEVRRGHAGLMVVEAEAGGGKTSLLGQVVTGRGESVDGFAVLSSEGDPNDQRALRCLAAALDCRLTSPDPARVRIAELLRGPLGDNANGMTGAVQELVVDVVERTALVQPVLLVIDDLHWVDDVSLAAIGSLTRRLRGMSVAVLTAARPSPRVRSALAPFQPRMLRLGPLADEDLARLAETITGSLPSERDLAALGSVRSNPFLVSLLVTSGRQSEKETGRTGVPPDRHDAFRRMRASLGPTLSSFIELAALAGRDVDVELLAAASDERVATAVTMTREAVQCGWMVADNDSVRFRHDLLVEALVADLPFERRDRLHLRLGRTLAELGHAPGRAAFHLDAASYLLVPADVPLVRRLVDVLPWDDDVVLSLAQRAHALDPTNVGVICALMKCFAVRNRHADAVQLAQPWLDATADADWETAATVRLLAIASVVSVRGSDDAVRLLQDGLDHTGLRDDLRADSLNSIARLHWYRRDAEAVREAATEALRVSRQAGYANGEIQALCSLSEAAALIGELDDALRCADDAVRLSQQGRGRVSISPELALGTALVSSGRFREGLPVLTRSLHEAERAGDPVAMAIAQVAMQGSRFHIGDWDGFVADADAMAEIGRETGIRNGIVLPLGLAAVVAVRRGQHSAVAGLAARVRAESTMGDSHPAAVAGLLLAGIAEAEAAGRLSEASAAAMQFVEALAVAGYTAQSLIAMDAARLAWEVGDAQVLAAMAELTRSGAERAPTPTRMAMASLCAALASGDAEQLVESAGAMASTERAWDAATALHMAGMVACRERRADGASLLADCADRYRRLGCHRHAAVASAARGFASLHEAPPDVRSEEAGTRIDVLSAAERRVLDLVVHGRANGDIAAVLFVSKRTVESHIAALYRKLGVLTRVSLAVAGAARPAGFIVPS